MLKNITIYLLIGLSIFLTVQWLILYVQGPISNPYPSLYRAQEVRIVEELELKKGEKRVLIQNAKLQVIQQPYSRQKGQSGEKKTNSSQYSISNSQDSLSHFEQNPQSSQESIEPDVLVNRFSIEPTLTRLIGELFLREDGSTYLQTTPDPEFFSLGRLRELSVFGGYETVHNDVHNDTENQNEYHMNPYQWFLMGEYRQDLFELGFAQTKFLASVKFAEIEGFSAQVAVGVGFRF